MSEKLSADDVAYVRREKKVDEEIQQKLTELYGRGKRNDDPSNRSLKRGWECRSCGYLNFECRLVCGECLDASPAAKELTSRQHNVKRVAVSNEADVKILQIGDRCYRSFINVDGGNGWAAKGRRGCAAATAGARDDDEPPCPGRGGEEDDDDDDDDDGVRFDPQRETFEAVVKIPQRYFKFIIGTGGQALQETQRLTGATVILPSTPNGAGAEAAGCGNDEANVIIRAATANSVRAAQIRLDSIVLQCRDKVDYTHFLMIPLGKISTLQHECQALIKDMIAACCSEEDFIDETIFVSPSRLHFTLLMLRLHSVAEIEKAKATLQSLEKDVASIFAGGGANCHFGGLHYMNDDPTQVHVLYLGMDPVGSVSATKAPSSLQAMPSTASSASSLPKVQSLVQLINKTFVREGFALDKDISRNEKIHATIMNTKWRRNRGTSGGFGGDQLVSDSARIAFDATNVLHMFGGLSLGVHKLDRIELCSLKGSASTTGTYPCEAFISIQ